MLSSLFLSTELVCLLAGNESMSWLIDTRNHDSRVGDQHPSTINCVKARSTILHNSDTSAVISGIKSLPAICFSAQVESNTRSGPLRFKERWSWRWVAPASPLPARCWRWLVASLCRCWRGRSTRRPLPDDQTTRVRARVIIRGIKRSSVLIKTTWWIIITSLNLPRAATP